jgi:hypothetical protein
MLEKDGTLYTANYRSAKSTNTYTAAKDGTSPGTRSSPSTVSATSS